MDIQEIVSKTVSSVVVEENNVEITFSDGSIITIYAHGTEASWISID